MLSSAFTSVNHSLLLHKLQKSYHLSGAALDWFRSYLYGREQSVVLNGKCSDWAPVKSGVPEGSICGPILFALYCNDAPSQITSPCLMYADDIKLYRQIRSHSDTLTLQSDLDSLCRWSTAWKLSLNPSKCKTITFTLRKRPILSSYSIAGTVLERVLEIRDLGILLDSKLTFGPHVDNVAAKANRALGVYLRSLQTCRAPGNRRFSPGPIIAGYNAHIRSIMEFGSVIWGGAAKSHILRLERIQHKFLMWLATHSNYPSTSLDYADLLLHFDVMRIENRLVLNDLNYLFNVFSGRVDSAQILSMFSLAVPTRTRSSPVLYVPVARVDTVRNGMFCRLPRHANHLYSQLPSADLFGPRMSFRKQAHVFTRGL